MNLGVAKNRYRGRDVKATRCAQLQSILPETLAVCHARYLGVFFGGITGAAITMKYNQMNAELVQHKKLSKENNADKETFII